ncbi:uncharacterized protein APUU_51469A [Aspergillus puulaauensis]|uniref:Uncharacterized protein n=1 Tax=Aspergillus puulaauensis TaxID=1220207 RepID=A0A7R7XTT9_9EURO|nr:uncharacterized protein APUU_51469A [Aspergillus puulaauensis]BCS26758.1 hypothetical protein APUU_51469A [Aspergillus puulaauensis]
MENGSQLRVAMMDRGMQIISYTTQLPLISPKSSNPVTIGLDVSEIRFVARDVIIFLRLIEISVFDELLSTQDSDLGIVPLDMGLYIGLCKG